jgi:hypothetical protein
MRNSTEPTSTAGNAPISTPSAQVAVLAGQLQTTQSPMRSAPAGEGVIVASHTHVRVRAMLCCCPSAVVCETSAQGLNAFTDRYG